MEEKTGSKWKNTKKFETHLDNYYDIHQPYRKNLHTYILGIFMFDSIICLALSYLLLFSTFSWVFGGISAMLIVLTLMLFKQKKKEYRFIVYIFAMLTAFGSLMYIEVDTTPLIKSVVIILSVTVNGFFLIDNLSIESAGSSKILGIFSHSRNVIMFWKYGDSKDEYRNLDESN